MKRFWFRQYFIWGFTMIFFLGLAACNGNSKAEATVQAVALEIVSTNTPTATPTLPPTPTNTPLPPTNTATPFPTDTPVPPTPTSTPTPIILLQAADETGDVVLCDTQASGDDAEVDFTNLLAEAQPGSLSLRVWLQAPLESDYSFAVLLALRSDQDTAAYVWEVHDELYRIGSMDLETGEIFAESGAGLTIEHDLTLGELTFTVPYSATSTISSTTTLTETVSSSLLFLSSFHTPTEGEPKYCDTFGPLTLPGSIQTSN